MTFVSPILPIDAPPALTMAIEGAVNRTLDQHGILAFEMSREAAIVHEVGHAIVGTHEGLTIRSVCIFSQAGLFGEAWGGRCMDANGQWTSGPDSTADADLRRARIIVAGIAGEAITGNDKAGSSLDEVALSQLVAVNAAAKLADPHLSDEEYDAWVKQLWHREVWDVAVDILRNNREPFWQIAQLLHANEKVKGRQLREALAGVRRVAS